MTLTQTHLPTTIPAPSQTVGGGSRQVGQVVQYEQVEQVGQYDKVGQVGQYDKVGQVGQHDKVDQHVPTAGSPMQVAKEPSWFAKNIKLIGIVGGAAVGGAVGFLTLGPIGGLGGAAVGALAGYMLTRNSPSYGGNGRQVAPPLPPHI